MINLKTLSIEDIRLILNEKKNINIVIPGEILDFEKSFPDLDFTQPQEIQPTLIILAADGIAQVLIRKENNINGVYIQIVVFVYALGGKIFYTKLSNGDYEAEIKW